MAVEKLSKQPDTPQAETGPGTRFPPLDLKTCIEVPRILHDKGGGQATPDQMAAHLGYKGTNNGAYLTKVGAAKAFGLIAKVGPIFVPTSLAHRILSPTYPHDAKKALLDAFLTVPLFKKIYEDFRGRELPPESGMKNALRMQYGVSANRVKDAYRSLMDSADTAGFFETKNGARTHLILPLIQPITAVPPLTPPATGKPNDELGGNGGVGNDDDPPPRGASPGSVGDVKAKYLSVLIKLFEGKAAKGELDEKLMERIERLLGESTPTGTV